MQFEEFDNRAKEAAEHHYPAYDENAWGRMEKLLDKHLPQENDNRRRIIFFLFLFLALGGGAVWLFSGRLFGGGKQTTTAKTTIQKPAGINSVAVSSNEVSSGTTNQKPGKEIINNTNITGNNKTTLNPSAPVQPPALLTTGNKNENQFLASSKSGVKSKKLKTDQQAKTIKNDLVTVTSKIQQDPVDNSRVDISTTNATVGTLSSQQKNDKKDIAAEKNSNSVTKDTKTKDEKTIVNDPSNKENTNKDNTTLAQNSQDKKTKGKNKKGNTFFFSLSAGPDISATGGDKPGKVKVVAGVGLGYTIKDRLTIRSGFYTGRKVYTSSPGSYHPPASFWSYYPNLEKVDADCKVYEIPLSLSYNFGHSSKQNWFASAGISSYLMKKETYNYYYKYTPSGPTVNRKYTILDENKHYFSVLTLSGGFQKNIGKNFSIVTEPYFKLPLGGVGFGKVKLNSGGILFSAVIKPFAGSGKQNKSHR